MPIVPQSSRMILPPLQLPQSAVRCQTAAAEEQVGLCRGSRRHVLKLAGDRQIELCCARPAVQGKTGMPSGLKCWPCAVVLLHLLSSTDWVKGKTVLELGAGPGLAGLGAALFGGARSTVLTDCNKQVLRLLKHNVMLNHAAAVTVAQLDFTSRFEIEELMEELGMGVGVDVVLACEVTYDAETIRAFWRAVDQLLAPSGILIVARELRANRLETALSDCATQMGFVMEPPIALDDLLPELSKPAGSQSSRPSGSTYKSNRPELPTNVDPSRFQFNVCRRQIDL